MWEADEFDDESGGTVFRDVLLLALIGFVAMVVMLLPHLARKEQKTEEQKAPGNVVVEIHWPGELDADVDLWVQAPGDVPVGYSNQGGAIFNLLRDDMGQVNDTGRLNYEIAFSRGAPAGEYTVNLHLYSNVDRRQLVPAEVTVGVKKDERDPVKVIARKRVELARPGQEITVVRFALDQSAMLIPGSVHDLPKPLRATRK